MNKIIRLAVLFVLITVLTACGSPSAATDSPDALSTQVEQTVQARLTVVAPPALASATLSASATPPGAVTTEAAISSAAPSQPGAPCTDAATFVADVTIPDGTVMPPGQVFTKTWRLKNSGTCTWTTDYTVALKDGPANAFWTDSPHPLPSIVPPGQPVDISVNLTAPSIAGGSNYSTQGSTGEYTAFYELRNAAGVPFSDFTAVIKVQEPTSADFKVTDVAYTVSTWSDTVGGRQYANCPLITAAITANGAGTVNYHWVAFDENSPASTSMLESGVLTFDFAGTKVISLRWTYRESLGGKGMMYLGDSGGIYIDVPNQQAFGGIFLPVCSAP